MGPIIVLFALLFLASPLIFLILFIRARDHQRQIEIRLRTLSREVDVRLEEIEKRIGILDEDGVPIEVAPEAAPPVVTPPTIPEPRPPEPGVEPVCPTSAAQKPAAPTTPPPEPRPVTPTPPTAAKPAPLPEARPAVAPIGPPSPPPPPAAGKREGLGSRLREQFGDNDWETIIGGNWMNKLGAVVLVVGLALLLGYSWARLDPPGRVGLSLAISLGMLIAGVVLERREQYAIFARGLIGGGWAGLYFTTFAMHGLEAARIIESPLVGSVLLLTVAAGMVAHSLYYRSETVTGLAFFITFATLAISPASRFALFASVPVAVALLYITHRLEWTRTAVAGIVFTYATFLVRYNAYETSDPLVADWGFGQSLLLVYWVVFEAYDLLSVARRRVEGVAETIFPLNAAGFLGISILQWSELSPTNLYVFFAFSGFAYLVSALIRSRLIPAADLAEHADPLERARKGGYEGAITLAAALVAIGIHLRFDGWQKTVAWLIEAQMLLLSGLSLRNEYLRALGSIAFTLPAARVLVVDLQVRDEIDALGTTVRRGVPVALLTAGALYANRGLVRVSKLARAFGLEHGYTYAASLLLALVIGYETPPEYAALGWMALGVVLFESSLFSGLAELRYQAYVVSMVAWIDLLAGSVLGLAPMPERIWIVLVPAAVLSYGGAVRLWFRPSRMPAAERRVAFEVASAGGTAFVAVLIWYLLPAPLVAVGWLLLGLALLEVGFGLGESGLRAQGHAALTVAFGRTFLANFATTGTTAGISHRLLTIAPMIAAYYYVAARLRDATGDWVLPEIEDQMRRLYTYLPAILATVLLRFELGRAEAVLGWTVLAFVLLWVGLRLTNGDFRLQAYLIAGLVFIRAWATNFSIGGTILGIDGRILTGIAVTAGLYALHFLLPRGREWQLTGAGNGFDRMIRSFDAGARAALSLLATVLFSAFLFYEVSGSWLTVAWSVEGTVLLLAGFALRDRQLRLSGLVLLGVCILKAFFYDFPELETVFRIFAFLVLGSLMIAVSFVYTRYREQIRRRL